MKRKLMKHLNNKFLKSIYISLLIYTTSYAIAEFDESGGFGYHHPQAQFNGEGISFDGSPAIIETMDQIMARPLIINNIPQKQMVRPRHHIAIVKILRNILNHAH